MNEHFDSELSKLLGKTDSVILTRTGSLFTARTSITGGRGGIVPSATGGSPSEALFGLVTEALKVYGVHTRETERSAATSEAA